MQLLISLAAEAVLEPGNPPTAVSGFSELLVS